MYNRPIQSVHIIGSYNQYEQKMKNVLNYVYILYKNNAYMQVSSTDSSQTTIIITGKHISNLQRLSTDADNIREYCENMSTQDIIGILTMADYTYHNTGEPILTDFTYDIVRTYLEESYPSHPYLKSIGAPVSASSERVQLPLYMGSMNKVLTEKQLELWQSKHPDESYALSHKMDGISALWCNDRLYTRGQGDVGTDISHLADSLGLKRKLPYAVRGELIIPRSKKSLFESDKHLRNIAAGAILSHKNINTKVLNHVRFIAYEVIDMLEIEQMKPSKQFKRLKSDGFEVVPHSFAKELGFDLLTNRLLTGKETGHYDIDGIIVTPDAKYYRAISKNPSYSIAFKINLAEDSKQTVVTAIEWNPSRHGKLIPRVQIEPVQLDQSTVQYITGKNAAFIHSNNIGVGARITVLLSGGIIPNIVEINEPANEPSVPLIAYEWDKNKVHYVVKGMTKGVANGHNIGTTDGSDDILLQQLVFFSRNMEIKHLSKGLLTRLIASDTVRKPGDILALTSMMLANVQGLDGKMGIKLLASIKKAILDADVLQWLVGSGSFVGSVGKEKLGWVLDKYPNFYKGNNLLIKDIVQIDGFSDITAQRVVDGCKTFNKWLVTNSASDYFEMAHEKMAGQINSQTNDTKDDTTNGSTNGSTKGQDNVQLEDSGTVHNGTSLASNVYCFTGFRDKDLEKHITNLGGKVSSSYTKKVTHLIVKDMSEIEGSANKKVLDAKKRNIAIISPDMLTSNANE